MNINQLPIETLKDTLGRLSITDRAKMRQVCRLWANVVPIEGICIIQGQDMPRCDYQDIKYVCYVFKSSYFGVKHWPHMPNLKSLRICHYAGFNFKYIFEANSPMKANIEELIVDNVPFTSDIDEFKALKVLKINTTRLLCTCPAHLGRFAFHSLVSVGVKIEGNLCPHCFPVSI
jgi:F-box domain